MKQTRKEALDLRWQSIMVKCATAIFFGIVNRGALDSGFYYPARFDG